MDFYFVILSLPRFLRTRLRTIISFIVICSAVQGQTNDDYFTVLPRNITTRLTFPARFDCQTDANTGFIYWTVGADNRMISESSCPGCRILQDNGSLYFPSVSQAHANRYTCFIILQSGVSMQPRAHVYLTVAEDPEIITPASDITVNQNEMLEINVQVTGVPQPNITWRKDGEVINSNPRFTFNGSNLSLPNTQHTDAGVYTIRAENIANLVERSYNAIVRFLPIIEISRDPDRDLIEEDTMVTMTCRVRSNPESSISWEQVTANERTKKTDQATTEVLANDQFNTVSLSTISFTDRDVSGSSKFCCRGINDLGTATKCLNFTEIGTPSVPTDFTLTGNTSSSASISWVSSMTGPDIVYNISWMRNGELVNYTTVLSSTTSYTIEGLDADTEYVLMINAINTQSGKQSFTATITMRTLVAVPGEVVGFAVEVLGTLRIFRLTWQAPERPQIINYIIYIRIQNGLSTLMVLGGNTSFDYPIHQEKVVYEFAVQAVSEGGRGPVSNYMAVFYCSTGPSLEIMTFQRFSDSVNIVWNLTSGYKSDGIYIVVREKNNLEFITPRILSGTSSQCISNLKPNTDYSVTVLATFNCDNVSQPLDFRTLDDSSSASVGNCIRYNPWPSIPNATDSSSVSDDDIVSVAVVSGVTLLLTIIIIVVIVVVIFYVRRNNSKRKHGVNIQLALNRLHQHTDNTSGNAEPTSRLETVNALYIPTTPLDSVLQRSDHRTGSDVIITPNASYSISVPNSPQSGQQSEYLYDDVLTADNGGVVRHNQSTTTSGGGEISVDDVINPSYSVVQDVKLQDNPSYEPYDAVYY